MTAVRAPQLRREVGATARLAGPVVAAQLAQISMGFVDTVMVGRLGSTALAGVALGNTVFFFVAVLGLGMVMAVGPMVSQAYGAGDDAFVARSTRQGLWLAVLLAVPAFVLLRHMEPVLRALGQAPEVAAGAAGYLRAIAWGFLPFLGFTALRSLVEGVSRPWPVTAIAFAGVGLNIVANSVLMFGKLGFPALGLVGTGWASAVVFWFICIALAVFVHRHAALRRYAVWQHVRRPDGKVLRELFRIGWPVGVALGIESGLFTVTALLMGRIGTTALAAHQVALQCAAFTFMVPLGIGIAASVRVGQAVGRGDAGGVRRAGAVGVALAALFMGGAGLLFWLAPRPLVGLYLDVADPANAPVVRLAVTLLGIAAFFQLFDGVQVSAAGALRGLKDTRVPMVVCFLAYWVVGLGSGYVLGFALGLGAPGLWWGLVLGLATAAVLLSLRFAHRTRRRAAAPGRAEAAT